MGPGAFVNGILCPASDFAESLGKPLVGGRVTGVELNGFSELCLATGKIPVVFHHQAAEDGVRVGQ